MPETILYGLVSDQAAANLLPAMQLKPGRMVLFHSLSRKEAAGILSELLKERGIRVELVQLDSDTDYERIKTQVVDRLAEDAGDAGNPVLLNVTGGTKLMALAMVDAADALDTGLSEAIYLDFGSARLIWLDRPEASLAVEARIGLKDYLRAYGISILKSAQAHPDWNADELQVFRTIAARITAFQPAITRLNGLAATAEIRGLRSDLENPDPALNELVDLFARLGKLKIDGKTIRFPDRDALDYVKGVWFEHFAFQAIAEIQKELGITDKLNSAEIYRTKHPVYDNHGNISPENEIDSMFMCENRVYVVECKTSRMRGETAQEKANDQLHKLANLAEAVGGLGARAAFVSLQNLGDAEKRLARRLGIKVIHGTDLKDLRPALTQWIRGRH